MEIEIDQTKWTTPLQEYISQIKNCVIALDSKDIFKERQANSPIESRYTKTQLDQMEGILDFVKNNSWIKEIIQGFIETLPLAVKDYRSLMSLQRYASGTIISQLLTQGLKWTLNFWSVYEQCGATLSLVNRNQTYYQKMHEDCVIDFVKLAQASLYLQPVRECLRETPLSEALENQMSSLLLSIQSERFFDVLERKMGRLADYWYSQIKRDMMNLNRDIPQPIIQDRTKEAKNTLELLHYVKLVVKMSDEGVMMKSSFWPAKPIFQYYLCAKNIDIFVHAEKIFVSMGTVCKNANLISAKESEEYKKLINAIFKSVIDFFDVVFDKLQRIHVKVMKKASNKSQGTKRFLESQHFEDFLFKCGHVEVTGAQSKVRDDTKNIKFFKILLFYSKGFKEFVGDTATSLGSQEDLSSQILCILNQMISEVEAFRNRKKQVKAINEKNAQSDALVAKEIKPQAPKSEGLHNVRGNKRKSSNRKEDELTKYLKVKPTSEAIIFSNEQDEEGGYKLNRKPGAKMDAKTKKYLEYIKQYQYNDEYDDSLEFGAKLKNKRNQRRRRGPGGPPEADGKNNGKPYKTVTMKDEYFEQDNEDDLEDYNPAYNRNNRRGDRYNDDNRDRERGGGGRYEDDRDDRRRQRGGRGGRRRHDWEVDDRDDDDRDDRRGGGRGGGRGGRGFNRRGRDYNSKRGRGRDAYQRNNRNKREYYNKQRR